MSAKAVREATGKELLNRCLKGTAAISRLASVDEDTNFEVVLAANPWLREVVSYLFSRFTANYQQLINI